MATKHSVVLVFDGYSTSFTGTVAPHGVLWLMDCASGQINDVQRHKIVCFLSKKFPFVSVKWHPVVRENFDDQFVKISVLGAAYLVGEG